MKIICAGEALVDVKLSGDRAELYPGGSCFNVAHYIKKYGGDVTFCGAVGRDFLGDSVLQAATFRRDIRLVEKNTSAVIIRNGNSSPQPIVYRGADRFLRVDNVGAGVFHTSAFALSLEPAAGRILKAMEEAKEAGAFISFDPNYRRVVWRRFGASRKGLENIRRAICLADLVKPSLDDAFELLGTREMEDSVRGFTAMGAKNVLLSMGDRGAALYWENRRYVAEAEKTRVVDTTGAGDALLGTFLAHLSRGYEPEECIEAGVETASLVVSRRGNIV